MEIAKLILLVGLNIINIVLICQNYFITKIIERLSKETNERLKKSLEEKTIGIDALGNNMSTTLNRFKNENNN